MSLTGEDESSRTSGMEVDEHNESSEVIADDTGTGTPAGDAVADSDGSRDRHDSAREPPAPGSSRDGGAGSSPEEEADGEGAAIKKKTHRRGKIKGGKRHRHWKPYTKLSWEERQKVDERETRRANQKREQQFASGQPMAPYNTTQFLMEQHESDQPGFDLLDDNHSGDGAPPQAAKADLSGSFDSSEEYDSPDNEDNFLEKEFTETYENCHAERLQALSKDELVREYLELESRVERLERRLRQSSESGGAPAENRAHSPAPKQNGHLPAQAEVSVDIAEAARLQEEIDRLRAENQQLHKERDSLATRMGKLDEASSS